MFQNIKISYILLKNNWQKNGILFGQGPFIKEYRQIIDNEMIKLMTG